MGDIIIEIRSLTKSFGEVRALREIDLTIPSGIFGLIGPNGAGKTTLFRILLDLIRPDSGSAHILGLDVRKESLAIRKQLGVLHERPTYPSFLTPLTYLSRMSKLYEKQRDPEELLDIVDLLYAKNRKIGNLSAGMYQRLGIAQSLMGHPKIVFLDEPTSNLDVMGRSEMLELILKINKETNTSFVISSHILSELQKVCQNIAILVDGEVREQGSITDIMKRHVSDRIRIITSDATQLSLLLDDVAWAENIRIAGPSSVTFKSSLELDTLTKEIATLVNDLPIEVFNIGRASDLEDIFMEVIQDA
ncbi:MAG: ATP-binding cassette domain-containing protein [Candidatus Thorarchaeota archaeon]